MQMLMNLQPKDGEIGGYEPFDAAKATKVCDEGGTAYVVARPGDSEDDQIFGVVDRYPEPIPEPYGCWLGGGWTCPVETLEAAADLVRKTCEE